MNKNQNCLVIFGANGFLGRSLARYFLAKNWKVIGVARRPEGLAEGVDFIHWDGRSLDPWADCLPNTQAIVNLAGRTVNCRYTDKNKAEIFASREDSTRVIEKALAQITDPALRPPVWLNSSTATIYRHAEDRPQDEDRGEIGKGFSVEVAKAWEKAFFENEEALGVRKVALRTAMVFENEPGTVYDYLYKLAKFGLGGAVAGGQQRVSWIHSEDFCRAIEWLIDQDHEHEHTRGIYNVVAPEAETNATVMKIFREIAGCPIGLPATRWMAEVGAFLLRTETELVFKSRWVTPTRLLKEGFKFRHPHLREALQEMARG